MPPPAPRGKTARRRRPARLVAWSRCLLRRARGVEREGQREHRALALARPDRHIAPVDVGDMAHDRQAQAGAARGATARPVHAVEALEDALEVPGGNPDPVVTHRDNGPVVVTADRALDRVAGIGYFTALSSRFVMAPTTWPRSH